MIYPSLVIKEIHMCVYAHITVVFNEAEYYASLWDIG